MSILPWLLKTFCFLLWSIHSSSAATINAGSFQKPSSNSDLRISAIQNELLKIQGDLLVLNTALQSGDNTQDLKSRMSMLEGEFQKLNTQLLDERRERTAESGKDNSSIIVLTNYYNSLDTQLKALQTSMAKKMEADTARQIPENIVEEIRNHRFSAAQELFGKIDVKNKIRKIVHDVYANSQSNTDILLDFTKSLASIVTSFDVLNALQYEMRANGHRDPYKMISVVKTLDSEVINQNRCPPDVKTEAQKLSNELIADINTVSTEILKTAVYADNYQKNVQVENLANALYHFRPEVWDEVMRRLVDATLPSISAMKLAEDIYSNKYISQIVPGLVALYNKLERKNDMNNPGLLTIRLYLVQLQGMTNYRSLSGEKKETINSIVNRIPDCSIIYVISPSICTGIENAPVVGVPIKIVGTIVNDPIKVVGDIGTGVGEVASDIGRGVANTASDIGRGVAGIAVDVAVGVAGAASDIAVGVADTASDIAVGVAGAASDIAREPIRIVGHIGAGVGEVASDIAVGVASAASDIATGVADIASDIAREPIKIAGQIFSTIGNFFG